MNVTATPVKTEAPATMETISTPVPVYLVGREPIVK